MPDEVINPIEPVVEESPVVDTPTVEPSSVPEEDSLTEAPIGQGVPNSQPEVEITVPGILDFQRSAKAMFKWLDRYRSDYSANTDNKFVVDLNLSLNSLGKSIVSLDHFIEEYFEGGNTKRVID